MSIDKAKFMTFLDSLIDLYGGDLVLKVVKEKVESGTFDIKEEVPEVKVGDRVEHKKLKYKGVIQKIAASGKTVKIIRDGQRYPDGYVDIKSLRLIKEESPI